MFVYIEIKKLINKPFPHYRFDSKIIRFYVFSLRIISFETGKMAPGLAREIIIRTVLQYREHVCSLKSYRPLAHFRLKIMLP
jgi:hypothetical protein